VGPRSGLSLYRKGVYCLANRSRTVAPYHATDVPLKDVSGSAPDRGILVAMILARVGYPDVHGLIRSTPTSAKSFSFLVARLALWVRQIAAICASYPLIGVP
jgi:hypothetical protein